MDLEHFLHRNYKTSMIVAVVLSLIIVLLAAAAGRSAINMKASLVAFEPTDVTVIAVVEPVLAENTSITQIDFLRREDPKTVDDRPRYSYLVTTSTDKRLVQLSWSAQEARWSLLSMESLYGE